MPIMGFNSVYGKYGNEKAAAAASLTKTEKEDGLPSVEKAIEEGLAQNVDRVEISEEGRLAAEQDGEILAPTISGAAEQDEEAQAPSVSDAEAPEEGGQALTISDPEEDEEETSEQNGGKVAVNVLKRARQIAAAKNRGQLQQVLALLQGDMSDCKAGLENGMCDESEIAKVEALINQAKARMSQVPQESDDAQAGMDAFDLASLM